MAIEHEGPVPVPVVDLVTLDERTADVRILQGTSNVTSTVTHRLVYSISGFETYLVYWDAPNGARQFR